MFALAQEETFDDAAHNVRSGSEAEITVDRSQIIQRGGRMAGLRAVKVFGKIANPPTGF